MPLALSRLYRSHYNEIPIRRINVSYKAYARSTTTNHKRAWGGRKQKKKAKKRKETISTYIGGIRQLAILIGVIDYTSNKI